MMHQRAITAAFAKSSITRVALLDDAFDPPVMPEDSMGPLFELVDGLVAGQLTPTVSVTQAELEECKLALNISEYTADSVRVVIAKLFDAFVRTGDQRFDPAGHFRAVKANNLAHIVPLLALLRKCEPALELMPVGSQASDLDEAVKAAHLIFVDYYLNANLSPDGDPSPEQETSARASSVVRLTELLDGVAPVDGPSIVLMSSHKVGDRMETFRQELATRRGEAFASRFTFIEKRQFGLQDQIIRVEPEAFDSILEVVRSHAFGRALHTALSQWKEGAEAAIGSVWADMNALTVKDFSYLIRFRLAQEGMALSEYVEWFFNECLADAVGQAVDWEGDAFKLIDKPDGPATDIRGAYDGPTKSIAMMFDKVRIEKPRKTPRRNHRMGDLYLFKKRDGTQEVRALLTPDCDLIRRKSGACKARALLFVSGSLAAIDAPDASLSDFVILDDVAHNILWLPKDIHTVPMRHFNAPANHPDRFQPIGTLRPLYAYELRARVLDDLSRFGLNVPPALGSNASVSVVIDGAAKDITFELVEGGKAACSLVFSRGQSDQTRAVFFESAVAKLIGELVAIEATDMNEGLQRKSLVEVKNRQATQDLIMTKLSADGVIINGPMVAGMQVTAKMVGRGAVGRPWCQLVVSNSAVGGGL